MGSGNKLFDKTSMNISFPVPLKMSCSDIFDYFKVEFGTKDIHIKYTGEFDDSVNFEKIFRGFVFVWFVKEKMPIPFILSAERFGISLFYRELDFNKNSIIELLQTMENENRDGDIPYMAINRYAAKYAKPVKDNISFTRSLPDMSSEMMESKLNSGIENMMKGKYISEKNGVFFISKDDKFKIPLHMASSSARGLSDLYFYHGHVDRKTGQTLIIDEPESHLDTRNQILMARALARCVNAGVRVLITTHSDYIIKELNNLIMLSHDFPGKDKFLKEFKEDYDSNDYLCKDKVRAYVCREGRLDACEIDSRGMMMPLFDDVIYDINLISDTLDEYHGEEDQK